MASLDDSPERSRPTTEQLEKRRLDRSAEAQGGRSQVDVNIGSRNAGETPAWMAKLAPYMLSTMIAGAAGFGGGRAASNESPSVSQVQFENMRLTGTEFSRALEKRVATMESEARDAKMSRATFEVQIHNDVQTLQVKVNEIHDLLAGKTALHR